MVGKRKQSRRSTMCRRIPFFSWLCYLAAVTTVLVFAFGTSAEINLAISDSPANLEDISISTFIVDNTSLADVSKSTLDTSVAIVEAVISALDYNDDDVSIGISSDDTTDFVEDSEFSISSVDTISSNFHVSNVDTSISEGGVSFSISTVVTSSSAEDSSVTDSTTGAAASDGTSCALTECLKLHAADAPPMRDVFWRSDGEGDWAEINGTTRGGWRLASLLRLHELASVEEGAEWTVLCVGAPRVASFSYRGAGSTPAAVLELGTARDAVVGIVRLRSRCWLLTGFFAECSPSFIPTPYMRNLSLYRSSPLEEAFWTHFNSASMNVNPSWIRKMNITTFQGSIPANWMYNMNIPSLEYLHITGNDWKKPERIIHNMPKLIHLNLSNNNLDSLPEDIFNNMPKLEVIILDHNNIFKYPSSISRLKNLLHLDISNSVGNNVLRIEDEDLQLLPKSLEILGLAHSNLQANLGSILMLPKLHSLDVRGNSMKINNNFTLYNTSEVVVLDMSENDMFDSPNNLFSAMPKLEILILNTCSLVMLPSFPKTNTLTHLYASGNPHFFLSLETFIHLKKLEVLNLSHCLIQHILEPVFEDAFALKKVDMSYNHLSYIPYFLFSSLPDLQEVDISHNQLTMVFLWKWNLRKLDISSNELTQFRSNLSAIEQVILSYNQVNLVDISLSSVQKLNLSHNSLSYMSPMFWENISQTLEVDIGGNNFLCCSFEDAMYLTDRHDTVIENLGSMEPVKCSVNSQEYHILFGSFTYDKSQCRAVKESIASFTLVISIIVLIIFIATLAALAWHFLQSKKGKYILDHYSNASTSSIPSM